MSASSTASNTNTSILPMYDKTPLSHLLEVAVQKTYQELLTMTDMYVSYSKAILIPMKFLFFLDSSLQTKSNVER